jgi:hypothetical protein
MYTLATLIIIMSYWIFSNATGNSSNRNVFISATSRLNDTQQLSIDINGNLSLNTEQIQTLKNGIPIFFMIDIKIFEEKKYFFDKQIANHLMTVQLNYHALSNQYIVEIYNDLSKEKNIIDIRKSFPTLSLSLDFITHLKNVSIGTPNMISANRAYYGYIQFWLNIELLPAPMQLPVFFNNTWKIKSIPFKWIILNDSKNDVQK